MKTTVHPLVVLNCLTVIGMSTSVFTVQLLIEIPVGDWLLRFPAANLFFSLLTFPVTDIIADTYGPKEAQRTVIVGFLTQVITLAIIEICCQLPGQTESLLPFRAGGYWVLLGSTIAYFVSQFWDIWIFHWVKTKWTGEGHLWVRNNISTASSQLINSIIIITIVFGPGQLSTMLVGSILVKWILALMDTPLVYAGVAWVKRDDLRLQPL